MIRLLALIGLLALAPLGASAQQPEPVFRLTIESMAEPVPALKYTLLPQLRDRQRGNALLRYYRAFTPEWQSHRREPKFFIKVGDANEKPLHDVKPAEIDSLMRSFFPGILKEVDLGARRTYCDWEMNDRFREDGISLQLGDVQGFREFANLLKLRARQELLAGQHDKAARTLQSGFQLARHAVEGPTLIHGLVGVAVAETMLTVVDDWIDRPGAPNLYWALTDLPRPLLSIRNGLEGERLFVDWLFPGYRELLDDPHKPALSARVQTSLQKYAGMLAGETEGAARTVVPLLLALRTYPRAKRFLRQSGRGAAEIEAMPALQAVFLYELHQYDVFYDDLRKWASMPYFEASPHLRRVSERLRTARSELQAGTTVASLALPAIDKVLASFVRVERKVAALRCVEALRLYAAAHGGKLPAKLEDVSEVPIPLDPRLGKPFAYRLEGNKAVLIGPTPAGERPYWSNTIRYELTMRTEKGK
jgi:hypothetical protein